MTSYGPSSPPVAPGSPPFAPGWTAPPPGPGVQPPFAAPPIDGDRTRVWVGLGVGAAALVLCCVGGVAAVGGLMVTGVRAVNEQSQAAVTHYLDAFIKEDYRAAYSQLCDVEQKRETAQQFADRISRGPRVVSYTLHDTEVAQRIVVPADVSFTTGTARALRFVLDQDTGEGRFEVCGIE